MIIDVENSMWYTGSGSNIEYHNIVTQVKNCISGGGKVFVGTDSFISKNKVNFASAICIHGDGNGGKYFFAKEFLPKKKFEILVYRITEEVSRSVQIGENLMLKHNINAADIELHIDVSPFHMRAATSKFADMLSGYVNGAGFECRVKPDAWASQSVADKHSK
jgi:predicted RNase H-related nuclease YkuK (DUF458 family)